MFLYLAVVSQDTFVIDDNISGWNIECGKPLTEIQSSPFCSKTLFASYREFLRNIEVCVSHICVNIFCKYIT